MGPCQLCPFIEAQPCPWGSLCPWKSLEDQYEQLLCTQSSERVLERPQGLEQLHLEGHMLYSEGLKWSSCVWVMMAQSLHASAPSVRKGGAVGPDDVLTATGGFRAPGARSLAQCARSAG